MVIFNSEALLIITGSTIGVSDNTIKDQGQIDTRGYNYVRTFVQYTKNNSTGATMQIVYHYTNDVRATGATTFDSETSVDLLKNLDESAVTTTRTYLIDVRGVPFVSFFTKATTVGATIGTMNVWVVKMV